MAQGGWLIDSCFLRWLNTVFEPYPESGKKQVHPGDLDVLDAL
jgi:hypothetical protein